MAARGQFRGQNAPMPASSTLAVRAERLAFAHPGLTVLSDLSFEIRPGLAWVRGGDGRGKTTLLRLIAGELVPSAGTLERRVGTAYFERPDDPAHDAIVAKDWLAARQARLPGWQPEAAAHCIEALRLGEHLAKPMYMLSTGSRRKVGLVAAAAGGAPLTLVDMPFAALDAPAVRAVTGLLAEAAAQGERAWVVADHELPQALAGVALSALIDLGD